MVEKWWSAGGPASSRLLSKSVYKVLLGRLCTVLLPPRARTKSGWVEVDQELDQERAYWVHSKDKWIYKGCL